MSSLTSERRGREREEDRLLGRKKKGRSAWLMDEKTGGRTRQTDERSPI